MRKESILESILLYAVLLVVIAVVVTLSVGLGHVMPRTALARDDLGNGLMWLLSIVSAGVLLIILAFRLIEAHRRGILGMRTLAYSALGLLFGMAAVLMMERLWLVNAHTYPQSLTQDLGAADRTVLDRLRASECKGLPIEIYGKDSAVWILRCGFWWENWRTSNTFRSTSDPTW